ncbi:pentatricopeptide repeat (PPR) superfamily protein [Actinidia rufa]|uniref:Pentatricopeptide repeat (PPR) superfamily protein n=1 Tax=Actinidia rufa TaxID=165716 RepID=A0A7J0GN04_9ERIC|nr:pentatricopeptide repeat (PPR) superfamily protein [Actinidia rufa]
MWRPQTPLTSQHLRFLFLRCFSSLSPSSIQQPHRLLTPHHSLSKTPFLSPPHPPPLHRHFSATHSLSLPFSLSSRSFSSSTEADPEAGVAQSLSSELLKDADADSLSITQRLDLNFSHITLTPSLILQTLNQSPDSGRTVLGFHKWVLKKSNFTPTDETFSYFVDYFGHRKDFKAIHDILIDGRGIAGAKTLESSVDRLVRAGRSTQAVAFFEKMESDYGFARNRDSLKLVVTKLCDHGFASCAEKMVKGLANEFFPDEYICDELIKGWCVDGKLEEARRLAEEMYRGGFEISVVAYNAILDCVCMLCRKKGPVSASIRGREGAGGYGCRGCSSRCGNIQCVDWSLYQAARIGEGDEMIDGMKSAGFGEALDKKKEYYGFLKILCGIERIDHAMSVFAKMKEGGCEPGIKTYDLLMGKLVAHHRVDKANVLFKEAQSRGVAVTPKAYKLDPRFAKKPKAVKKREEAGDIAGENGKEEETP